MVHDVLKVLRNKQNRKKGGQKVLFMGSTEQCQGDRVQSPIDTNCERERLK